MNEYLIICDTETTGLDEKRGALLEVGFLVADAKLNKLGHMHWLWPSSCGEAVGALYQRAHPKVQEMHTTNGLWKDLYEAGMPGGLCVGMTNEQAIAQMVELLGRLGVTKNSKTSMCGRNPGFDLRWLGEHAPAVAECFDYHQIDICSVQKLVQMRYGHDARWNVPQPHRVVGDCENELAELKHYAEKYMVSL